MSRDARRDPVHETAAALGSTLELGDAVFAAARVVAAAFAAARCEVHEYDADAGTVRRLCSAPADPCSRGQRRVERAVAVEKRPAVAAALRGHEPRCIHVDDPGLASADRRTMKRLGQHSVLVAPLLVADAPVGTLSVIESAVPRDFSASETKLAAALAALLAAAVRDFSTIRHRQEQIRRLESLVDSSRVVSSSLVLEDVLATVARVAGEALDAAQCSIFEYDRALDTVVWRSVYSRRQAAYGVDELGTAYSLADFPTDRDILEGGEIVAENVSDPDLHPNVRRAMEEWGDKTCLNVPLLFGDEPMGILELSEQDRERRFTTAEIDLVRALGEQAAAAIQNAKLFRRLEEQKRRLDSLLDTSRALTSSLVLEEVFTTVARRSAAALMAPRCIIYEYDAEAGMLTARSCYEQDPLPGYDTTGEAEPVDARPGDLVILERGEIVVERISDPGLNAATRREMEHWGETCCVNVPLTARGEAVGILMIIETDSERDFSDEELQLAVGIGEQAAIALQNARLYRVIEHQAETDGLTGLYNHRSFFERLSDETARARRYGLPLSVLMLDIDDFKDFNDRHGHPAGDDALRAIGALLREQLRQGVDFPARYGGEEFAIILPSTPVSGALTVGARLCAQVQQLTESADAGSDQGPASADLGDSSDRAHQGGAVILGERIRRQIENTRFARGGGGSESRITVSIGVAEMPNHADDADGLVGAADRALYRAKREGKNRVEVAV